MLFKLAKLYPIQVKFIFNYENEEECMYKSTINSADINVNGNYQINRSRHYSNLKLHAYIER